MWPPGYYMIRDRLPLALFLLYVVDRQLDSVTPLKRIIKNISIVTVGTIGFYTCRAIYSFIRGTPSIKLVGFNWPYAALIEWGTYIILSSIILLVRTHTTTPSVALSINTAALGGWLYEIPLFIKRGTPVLRLNNGFAFFISSQIIAAPISLHLLHRLGYKPSKRQLILISSTYISYFLIFMQIPGWPMLKHLWAWFARLPVIIPMLYLITLSPRNPKLGGKP